MKEVEQAARKMALKALGPGYARRLLACYSVLLDGEGLIKEFGASDSAHGEVCEALRELRDAGSINF